MTISDNHMVERIKQINSDKSPYDRNKCNNASS
jgi:hypothetical protein